MSQWLWKTGQLCRYGARVLGEGRALPEDVGGVLELGCPFGLAAVAVSSELGHVCGMDLGDSRMVDGRLGMSGDNGLIVRTPGQ